jgi:hypothetical protein
MICAVAALLAGDFAYAQSCYTLQAELAHLQSRGGGGSSRDRARYERAWREQANVLARTEARARKAGCYGGNFLLFWKSPDASCRSLIPKIRDMQANLAKLDRLRRSGGGDGNARRIRELQAALRDRGCGTQVHEARRRSEETPFSWRGTYRTVCVRTCDGYYFPISFSTTPERFPEDAQTCAARCPGTEAKLFFYSNPGGTPEEMQSIDGAYYTALPTAFQFRTQYNAACACQPAAGFGATTAAAARPDIGTLVDVGPQPPQRRPEPGVDPETLANRAGAFVPDPRAAEPAPATVATTADGRSIRVVGPGYWASPEQQEAILTPVPN